MGFHASIGLFIENVQTFLNWKTEAYGLPAGIFDINDPEFDFFIAAFKGKEGGSNSTSKKKKKIK